MRFEDPAGSVQTRRCYLSLLIRTERINADIIWIGLISHSLTHSAADCLVVGITSALAMDATRADNVGSWYCAGAAT